MMKSALVVSLLAGSCLGQVADIAPAGASNYETQPSVQPEALGTELFKFDAQAKFEASFGGAAGSVAGGLGVAYGWDHLWVSTRGNNNVAPHYIGKFKLDGTLVKTYQQNAAASSSAWGGRDGAVDEANNYLYFGHETGVLVRYTYNSGTGDIDGGTVFTNTALSTIRALALLPNGNLITANFSALIPEFTPSAGLPIASTKLLPSGAAALYGLAYDANTDTVWSYAQDAGPMNVTQEQLVKFHEHDNDGAYTYTGRTFDGTAAPTGQTALAGGAEVICYNGVHAIAALSQSLSDIVYYYDLDNGACGNTCYADCDGSGGLDFFDFLCFQNEFAAGAAYADCDGSGGLDFFDFLCFQNEFAAGCP